MGGLRQLWIMLRQRWGRRRYRAVIVGRESGNRLALDIVTFRTVDEAMAWCVGMNEKKWAAGDPDLTYYDYEKMP